MMNVKVFRVPMDGPDDVSGIADLFDRGECRAEDVVAIIAKTEGNGRVNDFSRPFAHHVLVDLLAERTGERRHDIDARVALVMSGGCEGVMSPHATVFTREAVAGGSGQQDPAGRLAIGLGFTRTLLPEEIGTMVQVNLVAEAVRTAMADAGIERLEEVHYVQVKCPLLTSERINDARARGKKVVVDDTTKSMGYSNGASGLGIAVGLGEIDAAEVDESVICRREDLYPTRGGASAGIELMNCQVVLLGNSRRSVSRYRIGHHILLDLIDADGVRAALRNAGLAFDQLPSPEQLQRVVQVFAKGLVDISGRVRGRRITLLTDSDLGTRPARAVLNAVVASVVGDPAIYASAGWGFHQGPVGGGVAAAIVAME